MGREWCILCPIHMKAPAGGEKGRHLPETTAYPEVAEGKVFREMIWDKNSYGTHNKKTYHSPCKTARNPTTGPLLQLLYRTESRGGIHLARNL